MTGAVAAIAAVLHEKNGDFALEPVRVGPVRDDEVLVRIVATGICHTDLNVRRQSRSMPLPAILGHEGAGVVEAVGAAVTSVTPGDHVVMSYLSCGECAECRSDQPASCDRFGRLCFASARPDGSHAVCGAEGQVLNDRFFGQSSFATHAVVHERGVIPVGHYLALALLAPLGCGVMTGAGAVWNELQVTPGKSFAVFGAGAVGLSALMAARVSGATTIIAVDLVPGRLELARSLGATHVINPLDNPDVVGQIRCMLGDGVDFALDTTGAAKVIEGAFAALRQRGTLGLVACADVRQRLDLPHFALMTGCKRVIGIIEGGGSARAMIARLVDLHRQGQFPFDRLIRTYPFSAINQAAHDCETGDVIKPVLLME
jgi:aryl-alcohol dehydrogenase